LVFDKNLPEDGVFVVKFAFAGFMNDLLFEVKPDRQWIKATHWMPLPQPPEKV
jgi:hypothetical protein